MSRKSLWMIPVVGFIISCQSYGATLTSQETGVWEGTIGRQKIMACIAGHGSEYYYLRYSTLISLELAPDSENLQWMEGDFGHRTGRWSMRPVSGEKWIGVWKSPDGSRNLPIGLRRVKSVRAKQSNCYSFLPPWNWKMKGVTITKTPKNISSAARYQKVSAYEGNVATIQISGLGEVGKEINSELEKEFRQQIDNYRNCMSVVDDIGNEYSAWVDLIFQDKSWLSLRTTDQGSCASPHPFNEATYTTWSLRTGKVINLWNWIESGSNSNRSYYDDNGDTYVSLAYMAYSAPKKLNKIIADKLIAGPSGSGCADVVRENSSYQIYLAQGGLMFSPDYDHADMGCDNDIEVSFSELRPFLSKDGIAAVNDIEMGR